LAFDSILNTLPNWQLNYFATDEIRTVAYFVSLVWSRCP